MPVSRLNAAVRSSSNGWKGVRPARRAAPRLRRRPGVARPWTARPGAWSAERATSRSPAGPRGSGRAIVLAQFLGAPQPVGSPAAGGLQAFRVVELGCEHRRDADRRQVAVAFPPAARAHPARASSWSRSPRAATPHPPAIVRVRVPMADDCTQDEREPAGHRAITTRSRLLSRSSAQS